MRKINLDTREIASELDRYNIIAEYYEQNSQRIEPNSDYLLDIIEELLYNIPKEKLTEEVKRSHIKLINRFGEIFDYI